MGYTDYSAAASRSSYQAHVDAGTDPMTHTSNVNSGAAPRGVHDLLNPSKLNKAGLNIRESRDSDLHPNSRAVAVFFDVTGSMQDVPRILQAKLPELMTVLTKKAILTDPQILFGAIGDRSPKFGGTDVAPLQIGQFEAGNEIDEAFSKIFLEGGGGGQQMENYEQGFYYAVNHFVIDCYNRRGDKGYFFMIGDECPYCDVDKDLVKDLIGDVLEKNIPTTDVLEILRERFNVFWIMPGGTMNFQDSSIINPLKKMFGEHFFKMEKPDDVCEFIAGIISVTEGFALDDVGQALADVGLSAASIGRATTALAHYSANTTRAVAKKSATVTGGALVEAGAAASDSVARIGK